MIKIENLCKAFDEQVIFDNFSLEINDGEFVVISGESGKGKTTLLNMIGLLEGFDGGEITVNGFSLSKIKNKKKYWQEEIGFLFQNFALIEDKTVRYNLEIVKPDVRTGYTAEEALERVGLSDKMDKKVYTLSGGEQQRVALARLMIKKCRIILADEPTGSLDRENAEAVLKLLLDMNNEGKTVLIVTHDDRIKKIGKMVVEL